MSKSTNPPFTLRHFDKSTQIMLAQSNNQSSFRMNDSSSPDFRLPYVNLVNKENNENSLTAVEPTKRNCSSVLQNSYLPSIKNYNENYISPHLRKDSSVKDNTIDLKYPKICKDLQQFVNDPSKYYSMKLRKHTGLDEVRNDKGEDALELAMCAEHGVEVEG